MKNLRTLNIKSLKLFNGVLQKGIANLVVDYNHGVVIEGGAVWAKEDIDDYLNQSALDGEALNKTFHKSWSVIKESTREELLVHQILHYLTGYGTNFEGEVYIPSEALNVPQKLTFKVIKAMTKEELSDECINLLRSGIALAEETLDDIMEILNGLAYTFTGEEGIRNKEAIVKIADTFGVYPSSPTEFLRYVIYKAVDETLLIKNKELVDKLNQTSYNPQALFEEFGLEKLAEIFNRFKPLFLAFKGKCPSTINKISRLSKKHHKPMVQNPLNMVTSRPLTGKDDHWLDNATPFSLFKALEACHARMLGQEAFVHRIRNGKSWVRTGTTDPELNKENYLYLVKYMKGRFDFEGKKVYNPSNVKYALPTSEKMYVGNFPTGTKFFGDKLAAGVYWENSWGASDIDVSGMNISGKIGWNSSYYQRDSLMYSGDITDAPNGAVEYLWAKHDTEIEPTLLMSNVYCGEADCKYKIVVGNGADIDGEYMMNPNEVLAEAACQSVQKQTVLGMFTQDQDRVCFTLLNFGAGQARVSGNSEVSTVATKALYEQWANNITLDALLSFLGAEVHYEESEEVAFDIDLSVDKLDKTSIIKLFN